MPKYSLLNFHEVECKCGLVFACQTDHKKKDCLVTHCFRCDPEQQQARREYLKGDE